MPAPPPPCPRPACSARAAPRSFLYVHPTRLLLKAAEKALGRLALELELKSVDVSYAAHYEAFQVDEAGEAHGVDC